MLCGSVTYRSRSARIAPTLGLETVLPVKSVMVASNVEGYTPTLTMMSHILSLRTKGPKEASMPHVHQDSMKLGQAIAVLLVIVRLERSPTVAMSV